MANKVLLKDIAEITSGSTAPKDQFFSEKGLPFIRAGHLESLINTNNIDDLPRISEENERKLKLKKIEKGTILFAKSGMSSKKNRIYLCNSEAYIVNHLAAIKPDTGKVESSYLKYFLEWFQPSKLSNDQSYPSIRISDIGDIDINLPNKEFQQEIVKILDYATALINKRKAQIEALDQLAQSVFLEMFGDPAVNNKRYGSHFLSELCFKVTDGTHHSPPMVSEEGVPYVTAKHLSKGYLDFYSNPTYVSLEDHKKIYARCNPEKGDVLYIKDGATTGIAGINHYDFEFSMLSSLALIKVNPSLLNNHYLVYYLNNRRIHERITRNMSGGAIKRLTIKKINNIQIMLPPLDLQNKFASIAMKIENQKKALEESLNELEKNFNSIMQRAFKGELFTDEKVSNL